MKKSLSRIFAILLCIPLDAHGVRKLGPIEIISQWPKESVKVRFLGWKGVEQEISDKTMNHVSVALHPCSLFFGTLYGMFWWKNLPSSAQEFLVKVKNHIGSGLYSSRYGALVLACGVAARFAIRSFAESETNSRRGYTYEQERSAGVSLSLGSLMLRCCEKIDIDDLRKHYEANLKVRNTGTISKIMIGSKKILYEQGAGDQYELSDHEIAILKTTTLADILHEIDDEHADSVWEKMRVRERFSDALLKLGGYGAAIGFLTGATLSVLDV